MLGEDILENFGGSHDNNLIHLINWGLDSDSDLDCNDLKISPYYTHDSFVEHLHSSIDKFSVFSLNCQSLNAKFNKRPIGRWE